jgi:hypothetical protein
VSSWRLIPFLQFFLQVLKLPFHFTPLSLLDSFTASLSAPVGERLRILGRVRTNLSTPYTGGHTAFLMIARPAAGTTVSGLELFEAVQTGSDGFARSVQLSINQILSAVPVRPGGGGIGAVGTALATTGTPSNQVAFVANGGIGSTQIGALAVQQSNVTAVAIGRRKPAARVVRILWRLRMR